MALVNGSPSVILNNVVKLINQKVDKQTAPLIEKFTHLLFFKSTE